MVIKKFKDWLYHDIDRFNFNHLDYDSFLLLKKLDNETILFNKIIYESNFFFYHKLARGIKSIYEFRTTYIQYHFKNIVKHYEQQKKLKLLYVKEYCPYVLDYYNLTCEQYSVLDAAFRLDFIFSPFTKEKIDEYCYNLGWKCLKPIYTVYKHPLYYHYDYLGKFHEELSPYDQYLMDANYKNPKCLEYDEKKKFNEYDIYSKTNTRYLRYIRYNDFYQKNYLGKKRPTESRFDFSDSELKANFSNMLYNITETKYLHALLPKNKRYVEQFLREFLAIEKKMVSINYGVVYNKFSGICNKRIEALLYYKWVEFSSLDYDQRDFVNLEEVKQFELETRQFAMLNDPTNIAILPVIDAYLEIYRFEGYMGFDGFAPEDSPFYSSRPHVDTTLVDYQYTNEDVNMGIFLEVSLEHKELFYKNEWWCELFEEDYIEDFYDDIDEEHYIYQCTPTIFLYFWFSCAIAYSLPYIVFDNIGYNMTEAAYAFYDLKTKRLERRAHHGGDMLRYEVSTKKIKIKRRKALTSELIGVWRRYYHVFVPWQKKDMLPLRLYNDLHFLYKRLPTYLRKHGWIPWGPIEYLEEYFVPVFGEKTFDYMSYRLEKFGEKMRAFIWRVLMFLKWCGETWGDFNVMILVFIYELFVDVPTDEEYFLMMFPDINVYDNDDPVNKKAVEEGTRDAMKSRHWYTLWLFRH